MTLCIAQVYPRITNNFVLITPYIFRDLSLDKLARVSRKKVLSVWTRLPLQPKVLSVWTRLPLQPKVLSVWIRLPLQPKILSVWIRLPLQPKILCGLVYLAIKNLKCVDSFTFATTACSKFKITRRFRRFKRKLLRLLEN